MTWLLPTILILNEIFVFNFVTDLYFIEKLQEFKSI